MDRNSLERKLIAFIREEILRRPDFALQPDEPLISSGLISSFSLVQIAVHIEDEFGIMVPDTDLTVEYMDTIHDMVSRILMAEQ